MGLPLGQCRRGDDDAEEEEVDVIVVIGGGEEKDQPAAAPAAAAAGSCRTPKRRGTGAGFSGAACPPAPRKRRPALPVSAVGGAARRSKELYAGADLELEAFFAAYNL